MYSANKMENEWMKWLLIYRLSSVYSPIRTTKQWGTSHLPKGITQWPREIMFSVFTFCASTVSLAPTRLLWPPRHLLEGYDSCRRCCCQGSNLGPSAPKSDALTTQLSIKLCHNDKKQEAFIEPRHLQYLFQRFFYKLQFQSFPSASWVKLYACV